MGQLLSLCGIAIVAFASTNLDDLVLLVTFFADRSLRVGPILCGQFAGMAAIIALSLLGSLIGLIVPGVWLGLLGLLPIAIGLGQLLRRRGGGLTAAPTLRPASAATVALVTLANGGDNLSLYIPLFSVHGAGEVAFFCVAFLGLTALWCGVALRLARRGTGLLRLAPRWTNLVLPYAMIALGGYILAKTDALSVALRPVLRALTA